MKINRILILSASFIAISIIMVIYSGILKEEERCISDFQKVFNQKLVLAEKFVKKVAETKDEELLKISTKAESKGITILGYDQKGELYFWSDNTISVNHFSIDTLKENQIVKAAYSTFFVAQKIISDSTLVSLIHLENEYPYSNRFLIEGIHPEYSMPKGTSIHVDEVNENRSIFNARGESVFSIDIPDLTEVNAAKEWIATILLFLSCILFLLYLYLIVDGISPSKKFFVSLILIITLVLVRIVFILSGFGFSFFELFNPYLYATKLAPSLGDLILNSIGILFIAILIYRFVLTPNSISVRPEKTYIYITLANLLVLGFFFIAHYFTRSLVYHSSISFLAHEIDNLSFGTFAGITVFAFLFLSVELIILWVFRLFQQKGNTQFLILNFLVLAIPIFIFARLTGYQLDVFSVIFILLLYSLSAFLNNKIKFGVSYSYMILFVLLFSVYIMVFTISQGGEKRENVISSLAESLTNEHDPLTEFFFDDLSSQMADDTAALQYILSDSFNINILFSYLDKKYFTSGHWKKYDFVITLCSPSDSLVVMDRLDDNIFHCYNFFNTVISEVGIKVPNSDFYYLDNYTGAITYLGQIKYPINFPPYELSLFVKLDSKLTQKSLGYPELLLDDRFHQKTPLDKYSYAKYNNNSLISHSGDFEYSLKLKTMPSTETEKQTKYKRADYVHYRFEQEDGNTIIISKPSFRVFDILVTFSYIFVLYYLQVLLCISLLRAYKIWYRPLSNFRSKIQFTVISILLVSLVLIGGSTIWFNIRKFKQNQFRVLHEKIQSVYVELEHKLALEDELLPTWSTDKYENLDQLLGKFSDVFFSDINMYDPKGDLLATSRGEIFELGLQGNKMNPEAYYKMSDEQLASFIHRERINKLDYLSAYVPFTNQNGKLLAYLNLPYFTKQKELQEDLTTLTVAIINIYVLLILLTVILAVFISDQITRPLELIQDKFRSFKLGGRYEQIKYTKEDEIGGLVKEYNRMVLELEKSVELLAKSERESAWREMAKQIAHEIKNPLTPMRLSVQHLQRAWSDGREDFGDYMNRLSETLIEQIDNLSTIASEFSNFAQMPRARIEVVKLDLLLDNALHLFQNRENLSVELKVKTKDLEVEADKDQLSRVFINLVKNAIQAIPEGKSGKIKVWLYKEDEFAVVEVKDNGKGIPEEIQSKLFVPNFTTKSSGMGLGLAIVKNMLEQLGGLISFTTKINKGTTFVVKIPCR